jgi:hypothetical protein
MLSVINRDPVSDVTAEIRIANSLRRQDAAVEELNSDAIGATNSFETPDRVSVSAGTIEKFGDGATYTFPAHSLTVLTVPCLPELAGATAGSRRAPRSKSPEHRCLEPRREKAIRWCDPHRRSGGSSARPRGRLLVRIRLVGRRLIRRQCDGGVLGRPRDPDLLERFHRTGRPDGHGAR